MAEEEVAVGKEVLSYCTKCKMDLSHIIVSMKGDRISKVECKTCDKTHLFRAPKGITEPPKKRTRARAVPTEVSVEIEWKRLMDAHGDNPMKTYSMKNSFRAGDRLTHGAFGDGVVGKVIYPNKIEVVFQHDIKVLIHAGVVATEAEA